MVISEVASCAAMVASCAAVAVVAIIAPPPRHPAPSSQHLQLYQHLAVCSREGKWASSSQEPDKKWIEALVKITVVSHFQGSSSSGTS